MTDLVFDSQTFPVEETEAQRDQITCPKSSSLYVAQLGCSSGGYLWVLFIFLYAFLFFKFAATNIYNLKRLGFVFLRKTVRIM